MNTTTQSAKFNTLIATANLSKIGDILLGLPLMGDGRYTQYVFLLRVLKMYGINGTNKCPNSAKSYSEVLEQYAVSAYLDKLWKESNHNTITL